MIAVVGPTASGKTGLAIELALQFNGEVISADSRQIYRGLNIGTAKVTAEEMRGVPHHLIDIIEPTERYSVADFVRDAHAAINDITARGKLPIVAGGTFFYVDALLGSVQLPEVAPNPTLRTELDALSTDKLAERLRALDPQRAANIDQHNRRRLVRAIEIATELGSVPAPEFAPEQIQEQDTLWLGLERDRDELRERFRERATTWLKAGLLDEIGNLKAAGVDEERLAELGFEYRLGCTLLNGTIDEATFVEQFVAKNWQYAKRQMTWLRRNPDITWLTPPYEATARSLTESFLAE